MFGVCVYLFRAPHKRRNMWLHVPPLFARLSQLRDSCASLEAKGKRNAAASAVTAPLVTVPGPVGAVVEALLTDIELRLRNIPGLFADKVALVVAVAVKALIVALTIETLVVANELPVIPAAVNLLPVTTSVFRASVTMDVRLGRGQSGAACNQSGSNRQCS